MTELWARGREEISALRPADFRVTCTIPTRWRDNDSYGHVNNALYYEFFDTAINGWLLEQLPESPSWELTRNYVAESACKYLGELSFPAPLLIAYSVAKLGRTSVTYELAIFGDSPEGPGPIAALGRWVHVFVDPTTGRPTPIPTDVRSVLSQALSAGGTVEESVDERP